MALIRTPHTYLAAFIAVAGLACGPEKPDDNLAPPPLRTITSADALTVANRNLKNGLVAVAHNGAFLSDSQILGVLGGKDAAAPCPSGEPCDPPADPGLEDRANRTADAIAAQILNAANLELEEPTRIVLRLKPEVACATTSSATDFVHTGNCTGSYGTVAVRLELSSRHEGDVDVRLTVDNAVVASLELYASSLGAELDLGAAVTAYNKMLTAGGNGGELVQGTFQGKIGADLTVGASQVEISLSILSALVFDANIQGNRYRFEAGIANPLLSGRVDGVANKVTLTANSGGAKAILPLAGLSGGETCTNGPNGEIVCTPRPTAQGDLEIRIPSSSATIEIGDGDTITGEVHSGGAITVLHDGVEVINFDYNANAGRRLDWSVIVGENDASVELGASLSAIARLNLASLASTIDIPAWAQNETYTLDVNGAARPAMKVDFSGSVSVVSNPGDPAPPPPAPKAIVEMTAGVMRLAALNAGDSVTIAAGQCLYSRDSTEGQTPLQSLESRTCD